MPVETAADRAIFVDGDEFGAAVVWTVGATPHQLTGIFDAEYQLLTAPLLDSGVEGSSPQLILRSADVPAGAAQGDALAVTDPASGAVLAFTVVEFKPDGTGMTNVRLQETD